MIRARIKAVVEGAIKRFSAFGRPDEEFSDREYFQHYGFTSRPLADGEMVVIREGNHIVAIASDDRRYRLALEAGEVALYTDEGDKIHLRRGRRIEVVAGAKVVVTSPEVEVVASVKVTLTTPLVEASQDVTVQGNLVVHGTAAVTGALSSATSVSDPIGSMQGIRGTYNGHTHPGGGAPNPQM